MGNKQMAYQKFVLYTAFVLSSITFIYALGFATDIYSLNYHSDATSSLLYVKGAELYYQIQPFNKELLTYVAIQFGLCLTMFFTLTHRRRLYYPANYITTIGFTGYAAYLSTTILFNVLYVKQRYLMIDFNQVREITDTLNMQYVESTFMLDFGVALSIALYLLAAGLIMNLIWKTINMVKEKRQMRGA